MSRANEAAYPIPASDLAGSHDAQFGITIREHFAALAITSVTREVNNESTTVEKIARELGLASTKDYDHDTHWDRYIALRIRRRADALLAELAKVKP